LGPQKAQEITQKAQEITQKAQEFTHKAQEITHKAQEITHKAQEITQNAQEITHKAQEITPKAQEITHKAQEITHNSQEITHNSQEITHKSREITHKSQEITHKSREITDKSNCTVLLETVRLLVGLTLPPLYFSNGGVKKFLSVLKLHTSLLRSAEDQNTYLVNDVVDPLQRSMSVLNLQVGQLSKTHLYSPISLLIGRALQHIP
jgi:uncharacterized protein (DUF3084 family)